MAYGISLSEQQQEEEEEEQQTHPIYMALRAIIEQGTTALSKLIQVNICTNPYSIPTVCEGTRPFMLGYIRSRISPPPSPLSQHFQFTYGQRIWTRIRIYYGN